MNQITIRGWTWKGVGALVGLGGGLVSLLVGSVFTVVGWLTGPIWHGLVQRISTGLFLVTLPLLFFGAHCLDLIDQEESELNRKLSADSSELERKKHDLGRNQKCS